jgi:hypothetical protein
VYVVEGRRAEWYPDKKKTKLIILQTERKYVDHVASFSELSHIFLLTP